MSEVIACGMTPIASRTRRAWRATSKPATQALPSLGGSSVVSIRTNVVLPAPLGPSRPKTSPRRTSKLTLSTAVNWPKRLLRPSTLMAKEVAPSFDIALERDFRGHAGLEITRGFQHPHFDVKRSNILLTAA